MTDYRLEIKIRNARVLRAMEAVGCSSVSGLCRQMGLKSPSSVVYDLVNFKTSPLCKNGQWRPTVVSMAEALDSSCEELFPEAGEGLLLESNVRYTTLGRDDVARALGIAPEPVLPDETLTAKEDKAALEEALNTLTPREAAVLELRFGLKGQGEHTLEEAAQMFNVTRERIRQIESKALRKLRHPDRLKIIEGRTSPWKGWPEITDNDRFIWANRVLEAKARLKQEDV